MTATKKITISAAMLAMGILLPFCFHLIPNGGSVFTPMHLPIIICGFVAGPFYGAIIGLLCPLFSFLFTGMPMIAVLPGMMIELFFYGLVSGLFFRLFHTRYSLLDIYLTLIVSMLVGRLFGGLANYLLYIFNRIDGSYSLEKFFSAYFLISWPGILIQVILIPAIVFALTKVGFINESDRYFPEKEGKSENEIQIDFFNELAPIWGKERFFSEEKCEQLFAPISLAEGQRVLDIACGTGVLDSFLSSKNVKVDAIDLSPKMIEEAKKNVPSSNINFEVGDFYSFRSSRYDLLLVFDAYPHFKDKKKFVSQASSLLKSGGSLWIFFDCRKETINHCHKGKPKGISRRLRSPLEEARPFKKHFNVGYWKEGDSSYYLQLIRR